MSPQEKLFNDIKALLEKQPIDDVMTVMGQLTGAALAQTCPNKEEAFNRLFGIGARVEYTTNSYIAFLKAGVERYFAAKGSPLVLNAGEVRREFGMLKQVTPP